jgi:DNA invertase Pin-like site-specific DNA recombinase
MARTKRKHLQLSPDSLTATVESPIAAQYDTAVYTRLSSEDNNVEDGTSIETQKDMLVHYVAEHDDMRLYAVYCDNGSTGTNFAREDFQRMLDDIKDGRVNSVVVKDLSRFARNYIEAGTYIEKIFPFMGVRFVSVNDGYDSNTSDVTDIMVTMRNIINDAYVKDISRKIRTTFDTKQKNGDYIGWSAPYGFLKAEDNHNRLVIDPVSSPVIVQIFTWKADGLGFAVIARKLNEMGVPSPRMRNIENGRYKHAPTDGRFWTDASVSTIIKNPVYAGHMAQHKTTRLSLNGRQKQLSSSEWVIVPNTHEPIVSEELWQEAQAATRRNAEKWRMCFRGSGELCQKDENILKGLLICPYCNSTMIRRIDGNTKYTYHNCNRHRYNPACKVKFVREDALLETIFQAVRTKILAAADIQKALDKAAAGKGHTDTVNKLRKRITEVKNKVKNNTVFKSQLFELYSDGVINEQEFKDMKAGYADKINALEAEVTRLEQEYERLTVSFSANNEKMAALLEYRDSQFLTREMLTRLVEKITVYDSRNIEITWLFDDEYEALRSYAETEAEGGGA